MRHKIKQKLFGILAFVHAACAFLPTHLLPTLILFKGREKVLDILGIRPAARRPDLIIINNNEKKKKKEKERELAKLWTLLSWLTTE